MRSELLLRYTASCSGTQPPAPVHSLLLPGVAARRHALLRQQVPQPRALRPGGPQHILDKTTRHQSKHWSAVGGMPLRSSIHLATQPSKSQCIAMESRYQQRTACPGHGRGGRRSPPAEAALGMEGGNGAERFTEQPREPWSAYQDSLAAALQLARQQLAVHSSVMQGALLELCRRGGQGLCAAASQCRWRAPRVGPFVGNS